jgi:phosphoglycolate phosphatase
MARGHVGTTVYPGIAGMLAKLGGRKSTATTKGTKSTRLILEQFGLLQHFDHVQGTDGFPAKPEPDVLLASLKGLGARPEDALFVGDSPADMEAAKRAGIRSCAVRWGYGNVEAMARWEPDYWIDSPDQLLAQ